MDLKELCEKRYSVRAYLPREVEQEKIDYILRCAQLAPSAGNLQPWIFYVVKNKKIQQGIHESYQRPWFAKAPLYLVVCKDTSQSWKRTNSDGKDHADIDAAIASEHICLAAHEQGLGACWVCNFNPQVLKEALGIEDNNIEPVSLFPIGYIDEENSKVPKKVRKDLSEIVRWIE